MPTLQILFHHLDLPLTASQTHSYPLTWTYPWVPVWLRFDFIAHVYLIGLTPLMPTLLRFFENSDLSELPSSFRRSFWSFYRLQDPLSPYIPFSDKKNIYLMQFVMQYMIVHEWKCLSHLDSFFIRICFIPLSSFLLLTNAKCKCHAPNHADERFWTINLNVNFSMNASKMWCEPRFLVLIQVLLDKDANVISYDADVPCRDRNAKFIHNGASAHIYTMMQMSPCRYAMM